MNILIVETGRPREALLARHGTYYDMIGSWLRPHLPEADFVACHVEGGDALPDPGDVDGIVLSGSRHGVYEPHDWISSVKAFLNAARQRGKPVAGICFGHQIMAEAFGGKVAKSDNGWAVGGSTFSVAPEARALFRGRSEISSLSWHQDQIVSLPPEASVVLHNAHSPFSALRYSFPALSVQFHPEFSAAYVKDLLEGAAGQALPVDVVRRAAPNLNGPVDTELVGEVFAGFFRRTLRPGDATSSPT